MKYRKIPLEALLDILEELYDVGVDYIDISGQQGEDSDVLSISFTREYVNEEFQENFQEETPIKHIELNDDNINDAI